VALSPEEYDLIFALNDQFVRAGGRLALSLAGDPAFAGLWRDNEKGFSLVVAFAGSHSEFSESAIDEERASGVRIEIVRVTYTLSELNELDERLIADAERLAASGLRLASWGVDERANRVRLEVVKPSDADLARLKSYDARLLIVAVDGYYETASCTSRAA
jgi:hypothetical protein